MRYLVLASDYDGTLAKDGTVEPGTISAVKRLLQSGRKLILVTGRELPDLKSVFPEIELCERVVAENGALLYNPVTRETRTLADRPPDSFIDDLRRRGVSSLSVGEVIIATWRPHEREAIDAIRDAGLELQVIFNKDAVMILPPGVNKMTGLCAALDDLKLSRHNVVGIGDAENDHAFLESCECSVAVANAIPALKERATIVTEGARGAGVAETIDRLIATDLSDVDITSPRRCITIGSLDQNEITIPCYGPNLLICGQSGSGKSTFVTGLVEQIVQKRYQVCLIDPEGDYEGLENYRTVGDEKHAPSPAEVMQILQDPDANVVVNLIAVPAGDRPNSFISFVTALEELRLRTGRPHWLFIDEAHHVLPSEWGLAPSAITEQLNNVVLITVHPGHTSPTVLRKINTVVVVGREPKLLAAEFANVIGANLPDAPDGDLERSEALVWFTDQDHLLFGVKTVPSRSEHHRHKRKYAEGRLEEERMFRFRGPEGKLNLPAHNLSMFVEIAEGIDAETWMFHLKRGDYSRWFRNSVKDSEIADQLEAIEKDASLTDAASRVRVKEAILHKYAAPA